jgi:signal transduction histidine kinase
LKQRRLFQPFALIIVFAMLAVCILTTGIGSYLLFKTEFTAEVQSRLRATADLKSREIKQFRDDRLVEATSLGRDTEVINAVDSFLRDPASVTASYSLFQQFLPLMSGGQYNAVRVLNTEGKQLYPANPDTSPLPDFVINLVSATTRLGQSIFIEMYPDPEDATPNLSILVPILSSGTGEVFAHLLLRLNLEARLYPMVMDMPGGLTTGDAYLLDLLGDGVRLLSPSTQQGVQPLAQAISLEDIENPAAKLAQDQSGIINGKIGQTPTIAYSSAVNDSSWFLLVSQSSIEALAPVRRMLWLITLFVSALLLVVLAATFGTLLDTNEIRRKDHELQDKNGEMERFAYTVTHDLKSPLVTVKTFLNYLIQDIKNQAAFEQIDKDVKYIRDAADRMSLLLNELLKMSRIGYQSNLPVETDFRSVAQEAINAVAGRIAENGVQMRIADENISLFGDHSRLLELWQNLVENAVKYMGKQLSPTVEIGLKRHGRESVFFVRDNGIGIDQQFHERIFGVFEKLNADTDGTGLGLAVAKRIVEIYHGSIWVESPGVGFGATFKFTLPDAVRG